MLGRANVRDVGHPFRVGCRGREVPFEMIVCARRRCPCRLDAPAPPLGNTAQPGLTHQARDLMAATRLASIAQAFPHAWTPHDPILVRMQCPNSREQPGILLSSPTRRPGHPALVAAGRHPQPAAHPSDGKRLAAPLDHPIRHRDPLAKNVAASRKKSRSFMTRLNSRRSWANSSSRARPLPTNACAGSRRNSRRQRPKTVAPIPQVHGNLADTDAWCVEHRHGFALILR